MIGLAAWQSLREGGPVALVKVWISGGSGFVGSHLVRAFDDVCAPTHAEVDVTDADAVRRSIAAYQPDAIVHAAILNDFTRLERDGWRGYVGATRNVVDAAGDAHVVLVSTDWVFDGPASEDTPPNPINLYGMLKARARWCPAWTPSRGSRPCRRRPTRRARQDAGFGYFVAALVRALRAGEPFTVWEGDDINMLATPTLASDAAALIARIVGGGHTGVFHCCGGEAVDRRTLAERTVAAFGLDARPARLRPAAGAAVPGPLRHAASTRARPPPRSGSSCPTSTTSCAAGDDHGGARMKTDRRPGAGALPRRAGDRARRRAPAVLRGLLRDLRPRQPRRARPGARSSTRTCCRTTRRATSRRWCTSPSGYARQRNRLGAFACTTSIGPGATNMVTGAALATINRLPVLLLPSDTFATRAPHPVLQQLEAPHDATLSVNDCFKPVSRFFDRIERPEQLVPAALEAMRVLTDPAETGAVTLALPEDVQTEAVDRARGVPRAARVDGVPPAAGARRARAGGRADPRRRGGR